MRRNMKMTFEKIIFASGNKGKIREFKEIMVDLPCQLLSQKEAGVSCDPDENGETFEANALIKAHALFDALSEEDKKVTVILADDSGLEVDYLNKEPGVYSARYMGYDTSYHIKNANIIERLAGVPDEQRTARFVCAIAAVYPDGTEETVRGNIEGIIGYEERGENGFGYDPIFFLPELGKTTAELTDEEKNARSHRGNALRLICRSLAEK